MHLIISLDHDSNAHFLLAQTNEKFLEHVYLSLKWLNEYKHEKKD